ncbi:hypothetical protein ACVCAH_29265 [Micromonospora sp. LZ34]
MRRQGRLARTVLRGLLLVGGALGGWGAYDALSADAAHAAARPCLLGELLDGVGELLGTPVPCSPPADDARNDAPDAGAAHRPGTPRPPARTGPDAPAATGERPAKPAAPVRRGTPTPAWDAAPAVEPAAEPATPVTRRGGDAARPVERKPATAGPLEPVGTAVRPLTRPVAASLARVLGPTKPVVAALTPVVAALTPVLDLAEPVVAALTPVLNVVQPIVGGPAAPRTPPESAADVRSPASARVPTATAPTTNARATPAPPVGDAWSSAPTWRPSGGGEAADGAAGASHRPPAGDASHTYQGTPVGCGSSVGNGASGGWTGTADGALPWAWHPDLAAPGGYPPRCDGFSHRSGRPDTRPA